MSDDRKFWLVKSEPQCFSIHDLAASPRQTTYWDGVRNYQARNYMHDMRVGDRVLFYHSNIEPPTVVGIATVVRESYPDSTAWDPNEQHYDPSATPSNPIWSMVDLQLSEIFSHPVTLDSLKGAAGLAKMELLKKGSRLSVQPVSEVEYEIVLQLAHGKKSKDRAGAAAKSRIASKPVNGKPVHGKPVAKPLARVGKTAVALKPARKLIAKASASRSKAVVSKPAAKRKAVKPR